MLSVYCKLKNGMEFWNVGSGTLFLSILTFFYLSELVREGVKKPISYGPVRKRGGGDFFYAFPDCIVVSYKFLRMNKNVPRIG